MPGVSPTSAMDMPGSFFWVDRRYQPLLQQLGLVRIEQIFCDPRIVTWRHIAERENCTLDAVLPQGLAVRLHIKRFAPVRGVKSPAEQEADGVLLLERAGIPTAPLVAWGKTPDRRSFVITEDLKGLAPADSLIASGLAFADLCLPTAELTAKLHSAGLHHRDLYLCHFFVQPEARPMEVKLIDAARVRRLPPWPFTGRWMVKDLAQFWYSAGRAGVSEPELLRWLEHYARRRSLARIDHLRGAVRSKSDAIARHDAKLRIRHPERSISIGNP